MTPIEQIQDTLYRTPDTVSLERARLVTAAYRQFAGEPMPVLRARALAHVLDHLTLDLDSNPIFAGNTAERPNAWMLVPECGLTNEGQVAFELPHLAGILDGDAVPADLRAFWADRQMGGHAGPGHLAVDLEAVVRRGLRGILDDLSGSHAALSACGDRAPQLPQTTYRQATRLALEAVIRWAHRYAHAAEQRGDKRLAAACRQVPEFPARNLFEGLQAIALIHHALALEGQGMSVSIGLPDRVLAPFADEADADLIAAFMLKIAGISLLGRGYKSYTITVGGADHTGKDCSNALTTAFLDACAQLSIGDPPLFLRWHDGLPGTVRDQAATMLSRGRSMPLLVHDAPTVRGFLAAGVAPADAWEYCVIGCNELAIPGRVFDSAMNMGAWFTELDLVQDALAEDVGDMPSLLAGIERVAERRLQEHRQRRAQRKQQWAERMPMPLTSALMRGAAARGCDYMTAMPYEPVGLHTRGLPNAVNALAAIAQMTATGSRGALSPRSCSVTEARAHADRAAWLPDAQLTFPELRAALRDNFPDPRVREALRAAPQWGHDDERADHWAAEFLAAKRRGFARSAGAPVMTCHVVRSLHHLDGRRLGATADGRRAGEPLADSVGAPGGSAPNGPTAMLNSVAKIDTARDYPGGYNLNLTLSPDHAAPAVVRALIEGFFRQGGQELQINVLDVATLRAAQRDPERYRHLVVRVAGLSARFVELSPTEQEEIIRRAEQASQ